MEPQAALDAPRWSLSGVDSCLGPQSVEDSRYVFHYLCVVSRVPGFLSGTLRGLLGMHCVSNPLAQFLGQASLQPPAHSKPWLQTSSCLQSLVGGGVQRGGCRRVEETRSLGDIKFGQLPALSIWTGANHQEESRERGAVGRFGSESRWASAWVVGIHVACVPTIQLRSSLERKHVMHNESSHHCSHIRAG